MAETRYEPLAEPLATGMLSVLRHELVAPINLIVGYCELLMAEAMDCEQTELIAPLQSIRQLGFVLLGSIDQVLMNDVESRSIADLQELARTLLVPSAQLVEVCDSIALPPSDLTDETLTEDINRIRLSGSRMTAMAEELAAGYFPQILPLPD